MSGRTRAPAIRTSTARSSAYLRGLWPPASSHGRTLVTTRRRDAALTGEDRRRIDVGLFTETEAIAYLAASLAARDRQESEEQLTVLASDLGYLPLALAQAAAYLVDSGEDVAAYRALLADRATSLADTAPDRLPDDQAVRACARGTLGTVGAGPPTGEEPSAGGVGVPAVPGPFVGDPLEEDGEWAGEADRGVVEAQREVAVGFAQVLGGRGDYVAEVLVEHQCKGPRRPYVQRIFFIVQALLEQVPASVLADSLGLGLAADRGLEFAAVSAAGGSDEEVPQFVACAGRSAGQVLWLLGRPLRRAVEATSSSKSSPVGSMTAGPFVRPP
ncbi:hypothetical protein [Streptomyces sp. NPDC057494]|uniref:hypothetical protein n=1 Tax=Streptomyces sp. NPDC057494 TaxID=3346148 RepID=UPI0036BE983B